MLPYLIAGAIGFGIGKLFEEGGETFGRGGKADNTFVNVLLDYGFIETRGHYSIRNFRHNSNGYFAFVDMKNKNVEVFKDAIEGTNYSGFSIQGLIDFLNINGFKSNYTGGGGVATQKERVIDYYINNADNEDLITLMGVRDFPNLIAVAEKWVNNRDTYYDKIFNAIDGIHNRTWGENKFVELGLEKFANGGGIEKEKSLRHFILEEVSSGMIANKIPYSDYKTIDAIRFTALQILNRDGDREYSMKSFSDLIQEALLEYEENKYENKFNNGGGVKGIKNRAEKLLEESISYRWVNTDMGSGWSFELESPSNRSVFNILEEHTYLDEFSPEDAGFEDWDDLSEEDKDYYYQEWKEEFYQGAFERFKEKCMKHLDDFIEYLQKDSDENFAGGGGVDNPSKKEMLDYLNMYFDYYSELRTIAIEKDNILTRRMLNSLDNEELQMAYEDAKYEIKADTQFNNGGGVKKMMKYDTLVHYVTSNLDKGEKEYLGINAFSKEDAEKKAKIMFNQEDADRYDATIEYVSVWERGEAYKKGGSMYADGGGVGADSKTKIQITDSEEGGKIATRTLVKKNQKGESITYELTVGVFKGRKKGYFEIYATDSEDDEYFYAEGGLWIEGGRVVDYDGVYELSEKLRPLMSALNLNTQDVYAEGGMIEHGLRVGDEILEDFSQDKNDDEILVLNHKEHKGHIVNLDKGERYADGGVAKKRRRRANAQIGKTDKAVDKTRVAKPVGYRFTDSLASKLRKDKYEAPTEKQITKYLGKGIYKEYRKNKSDRDRTAKL